MLLALGKWHKVRFSQRLHLRACEKSIQIQSVRPTETSQLFWPGSKELSKMLQICYNYSEVSLLANKFEYLYRETNNFLIIKLQRETINRW